MDNKCNVTDNKFDFSSYNNCLIPTPLPADTPTHGTKNKWHSIQMPLKRPIPFYRRFILIIPTWTNMESWNQVLQVTNAPADDMQPVEIWLNVKLPNGDKVTSSHTCNLKLDLPKEAKQGHFVPGLTGESLISVVTLCNAGCEVKFTKVECTVLYRGRVILIGLFKAVHKKWSMVTAPRSDNGKAPGDGISNV